LDDALLQIGLPQPVLKAHHRRFSITVVDKMEVMRTHITNGLKPAVMWHKIFLKKIHRRVVAAPSAASRVGGASTAAPPRPHAAAATADPLDTV
jgi:hypothetical protein